MKKEKSEPSPKLPELVQAELFKSSRQPLQQAYLVTAEALVPMITRFLRRQQLNFKVSSAFNIEKSRPKRLILISPDTSVGKKTVPGFILSYLQELPHCQLFYRLSLKGEKSSEKADQESGLLIEYGFQYPLPLSEIVDHLESNKLYLISGDRKTPALTIEPAPILKNESALNDSLSSIKKEVKSIVIRDGDPEQNLSLQLNLELINEPQSNQTAQALYLKERELKWLEKIYKRLPAPLLAQLRWVGDLEHGILLLPEEEEFSLFPFGEPLKRVTNRLFLPLKQRLSPRLSNLQIEKKLELDPDKLTFLTRQWRFAIAEKDFQTLEKIVIAAPGETLNINFSDPETPFSFIWQNRNDNPKTSAAATIASPGADTVAYPKEPKPAPLTITRSRENSNQEQPSAQNTATAPTEILKEYALKLRRQKDFLGAATCFSLAEESLAAAECFRLAALSLEQQ